MNRTRGPAESSALLARMGKERFFLSFVLDHLRGLPLSARGAAREISTALDRVNIACADVQGALSEGFVRLRLFQENAEHLGEFAESTFKRFDEVADGLRKALSDTADLIRVVSRFQKQNVESESRTGALESTTKTVRQEVASLVELAEQINLLALNSVIEADHTGREGRPFALLAQEIRAIASATAEDARKVQATVERIEREVLEATGRVGSNQERYREGALKAGELMPDLAGFEKSLEGLRTGQDEFRRQYRAMLDHLKDIRTRYEQMSAVAERVVLTTEGVGGAMREEQHSIAGLADNLDSLLATVESQQSAQEAEAAVETVRISVAETLQTLHRVFKTERELSSGLDNAERLANDQASSASLAQRKGERLEVLSASVGERSDFIRARGQDLLATWESRVLVQVLALIGHIETTAAQTHEAIEEMGSLEERIRTIDLVAASIARLTLKIDMLALTGSLEAIKAGLQSSGFGSVASQVRQLAGESAQVADRLRHSAFLLQSALAVIRRSLDEAEGIDRNEKARSTRVRENLSGLREALRGLGAELDSVHQTTVAAAAQATVLLKDAAILASTTESTTTSIQTAARAVANTSTALSAIARSVEKVAGRLDAGPARE